MTTEQSNLTLPARIAEKAEAIYEEKYNARWRPLTKGSSLRLMC